MSAIDVLRHEGVLRKSGRYPWGSGENPYQRSKTLLTMIDDLKAKGMSDTQIVKALELDSTTELRAMRKIAKNEIKKENIAEAMRLKEKQWSNTAIGERMGLNESSVRDLLSESTREKSKQLDTISEVLKESMGDGYLDVGLGTENHLGISDTRLKQAVAMLKEEGYEVHTVKVPTSPTTNTTVKVLVPPDTTYKEVVNNQDKIKTVAKYSEDGGKTFTSIKPPVFVSADRVGVRYAEEGGADKDGVIELRRGVDDISLGKSRYAQVRIAVEGDRYLKGMAMYSDDLPDGVDMMFNTNKARADIGDNKLAAMKKIKKTKVQDPETGKMVDGPDNDPDLPFGSIVRQKTYLGKDGKPHQSVLNIVGTPKPDSEEVTSGEEGGWSKWSKTLSSQMLSKQQPDLARQQLQIAYDERKAEYDTIMSLTNPIVKQKLLDSFADGADSAAVHLKAAGLPRTANHVILPINSLKDTEIYAPNYKSGERVVLIRHPHGGTFEIPELTVNNRNREATSVMGQALDAVGINSKVAARLSGADFDGDTVLVIPQASSGVNRVKTSPPLEALKDFDHQAMYKKYDGMPVMTARAKQQQMGDISNLITDMTIKGAPDAEIARAVRHSMVVIDAEKHELNYKQSAKDHQIKELKAKYQMKPDGTVGGASTLISRAKSEQRVNARTLRKAKDGGPIDPKTGKKVWVYSNETYTVPAHYTDARTGKKIYVDDGPPPANVKRKKNGDPIITPEQVKMKPGPKSTKMAEADDARDLLSTNGGQPIEREYATHANRLKALANEARKESLATPRPKRSPSMAQTYAPEVESLKVKLDTALKNAPLERQARLIAKQMETAKKQSNPDMDKDELKKVKNLALAEARARTGAKKQQIEITPREWEAIQSDAITPNMLENILSNANLDQVKELAMPRQATVMVPAKVRRAKDMLARGYPQSEIAAALGVPVSTLNSALQ